MFSELIGERLLPGSRHAIIVLKCGHRIPTQMAMRLFRAKKSEIRNCPQGCGLQGIKQVESESWND